MHTDDDRHNVLLSARYGDLADVQAFVAAFPSELDDVHDGNGNTVLHMAAGNGHTDVLAYLLPLVSPHLFTQKNNAGSTPLHWAALNAHLEAAQALVRSPHGPGVDMIDIKNNAGRSSLGEAEMAGWDEGAQWFVEVMKLDGAKGDETTEEQAQASDTIKVEIQDADGQVAKMTFHPDYQGPSS